MTDPISDYLTRIRNAVRANHRMVEIPASGLKKEMTRILKEQGFIHDFRFEDGGPQGTIKIALKYNPVTKTPAIKHLARISKPGLRKYTNSDKLPRVLNGLGIAIISTSRGVMTNKEAKKMNIGGEIICYVY